MLLYANYTTLTEIDFNYLTSSLFRYLYRKIIPSITFFLYVKVARYQYILINKMDKKE